MTVTLDEKYDGGVGPEDFVQADEPPEPEAPEGDEDAPFGWTRDRDTGELRPRKKPGRPKHQPTPAQPGEAVPVSRAEDRAPGPRDGRGARSVPPSGVPAMPRGGVIAAGVNKVYRRAGKLLRVADPDLGEAVIACTRKDPDEPDELTVGEAWENLCKHNPRIRALALKAISGNDWSELVMAHAPIGIALMLKPAVQRMIPFGRVMESMAEPDEDAPEGDAAGLTAMDFEEMKATAQEQARRMAERMGMTVTPEQMAEATAAASAQVPPAFMRQQPRRAGRAQRRGR